MAERLAAAWEVRAGVIPGTPTLELTKRWAYTSADREEDERHLGELGYQAIFNKRQACAISYHAQLTNPNVNNWADLSFIWF